MFAFRALSNVLSKMIGNSDTSPKNPSSNMSVHVQKITLPASEKYLRTPLDWDALAGKHEYRVLSFVRYKATWVAAQLFQKLSDHPNLSSNLILLKSKDSADHTLAIYPISTLESNNNLYVDQSTSPPTIVSNTRRVIPGKAETVYVVCVKATGRAAEREIVKLAVETARKLVGGRDKEEEPVKEFWDSLGICTWESFKGEDGSRNRPNLDMLTSLVPDLPIKTFLIDDGWQDIDSQRRLHSFGPWDGMGSDMHTVVKKLKEKGCEEIGVWFTLEGYWRGIDPESKLIQKYDCVAHRTARWSARGGVDIPMGEGDEGDVQWLPSPAKAAQFWEDWFTEMKSWGIGFVKCDNQAYWECVISDTSAQTLQAMWSGVLEAVVKVWGSQDLIIMCMSHNDRMLNGPGALDFSRPAGNLVFRNSDDFNLGYSKAHADFIQFNTFETILTSHLSLAPDFDMFASAPSDLWPTYHALLRALSPGPTLLSDTTSVKSDRDLLARLTAKGKDGKLRAVKTRNAVSCLPSRWFWDNLQGGDLGPALMGASKVSDHGAIIGVWNARDPEQNGVVNDRVGVAEVEDALLSDEKGLDGEYALWTLGLSRENRHKVAVVGGKGDRKDGLNDFIDVKLREGECEAVVVAKIWTVAGKRVAVVGMLDKLAPLAGLEVSVKDDQLIIRTQFESSNLTVLMFGEAQVETVGTIDGMTSELDTDMSATQQAGAWTTAIKVDGSPLQAGDSKEWEIKLIFK